MQHNHRLKESLKDVRTDLAPPRAQTFLQPCLSTAWQVSTSWTAAAADSVTEVEPQIWLFPGKTFLCAVT